MTELSIAAVGDILMWANQINSAKVPGKYVYNFYPMFKDVAPYLRNADLTIGNLETTLSGREAVYQQKNADTGYPMFNCPDELAPALKNAGFDVLTTANNHCLDRGATGLKRTLNVLDKHQIAHTGTFRTYKESTSFLIKQIKGIKVGILSYTYGTNYIPTPTNESWIVNRINQRKILADIKKLKPQVDLVIVSLHFGREFHRYPSDTQKSLVQLLLNNGVDIILGAHPHVIQPMIFYKNKFAIYSLGNFISKQMWNNIHTESGMILKIVVKKKKNGTVKINSVNFIPTWSQQKFLTKGKSLFRVIPIDKFIKKPDQLITQADITKMKIISNSTKSHLNLIKIKKYAEKKEGH